MASSELATIFNECQEGFACHRKLHQTLKHVQESGLNPRDMASSLHWEQQFIFEFIKNLNQVLAVKKNQEWLERVTKFMIGYFQYSYQKDSNEKTSGDTNETTHTRFIEFLMKYLLQGIEAKEKHVRARICHFLSAALNCIDEISDELWAVYKDRVSGRLFDKEAIVRVQAIHALARFQNAQDASILENFLILLQGDPSAEVRKAVIANIELNECTLTFLLERSRDADANVRKLLFKTRLPEVDLRSLSIQHREYVLKNGLNDREPSVKKACVELVFGSWIKFCDNNLVSFLKTLDILQSESLASQVLKGYFSLVPNAFSPFTEAYFASLTPETVFIIRSYIEFLSETGQEVSEMLPELPVLLSYIEPLVANAEPSLVASNEFMIRQLLILFRSLDFSDEVARRFSLSMFRNMLINPSISDTLIPDLVLLLKHILNPRDLASLVIEVICDLRDIFGILSVEERTHSQTEPSAAAATADSSVVVLAHIRCLEIVKHFFSSLNTPLSSVPSCLCLINEVIVPAVNSSLAMIQLLGLESLGLAALLHSPFAVQYAPLFLEFYEQSNLIETKVAAFKALFDVMQAYGKSILSLLTEQHMSQMMSGLYAVESAIVDVAAEGFAKLILLGHVMDAQILEGLFFLYFHPETGKNPRLVQSLSFFAGAYASHSVDHQLHIAKIFTSLIASLTPILNEYEEESTLSLDSVATQLIHWTDPANLSSGPGSISTDSVEPVEGEEVEVAANVPSISHAHFELALSLLMLSSPTHPLPSRFSAWLNKLRLASCSSSQLTRLLGLTSAALKVTSDRSGLNALKKFAGSLMELEASASQA